MLTDRQFRSLRTLFQTGITLTMVADKVGIDEKTRRKYRDPDRLLSQRRAPRHWRTRPVLRRLARILSSQHGMRPMKAVLDARAVWAQARSAAAVIRRPGCASPTPGRSPIAGRSPNDSPARP